jgi:aminoglycoside 6-adenylyltransferase
MSEDPEPVIERLVRWGAERPDVRAMILTSTRTSPMARVDAFSDYDVILVVRDVRTFFEDRSWLDDVGRVLVLYRDPMALEYGLERFAYITQYEDGTKIDFTVWSLGIPAQVARAESLPDYLDVGYTVLLDKDGLTAGLAPPSYRAFVPAPPTEAEFLTLVEEFFHEATYVAKHLWRDELMPAKYNLDQAMKQVNLRRMLEWRLEIDHGWSVKIGAYGKGLKRYLDPATWSRLEATYAGADLAENWTALYRTIDFFRDVATEVAVHLGFEFPHDMDRRTVRYLRRVEGLDPQAERFDPEGGAQDR